MKLNPNAFYIFTSPRLKETRLRFLPSKPLLFPLLRLTGYFILVTIDPGFFWSLQGKEVSWWLPRSDAPPRTERVSSTNISEKNHFLFLWQSGEDSRLWLSDRICFACFGKRQRRPWTSNCLRLLFGACVEFCIPALSVHLELNFLLPCKHLPLCTRSSIRR